MPRNTYIVVLLLAVFAALVVGVNFGKSLQPQDTNQTVQTQPDTTLTPTPTVPRIELVPYASEHCGVTFGYPKELKPMEATDGNTIFINSRKPEESLILLCQKTIQTPNGTKLEQTIEISSASAAIYAEASSSGQSVLSYHMLFQHPGNRLNILISGLGDAFEAVVQTIQLK